MPRDKERQKLKQHESYLRNKDKIRERTKARIQKNKDFVDDIKFNSKCKYCEEDHPACLDFHHRDPKDKIKKVSDAIGECSLETLKKEIEKCDIVCSNCHRKLHLSQFFNQPQE